jgi:hypothetical protein
VLYYQSVSVILFLASHSLMVRQKKLECDLWYTTFPETQLKTSLIFGPPSTTVKAQSFSRSNTWSFCRSKIILDRSKFVLAMDQKAQLCRKCHFLVKSKAFLLITKVWLCLKNIEHAQKNFERCKNIFWTSTWNRH